MAGQSILVTLSEIFAVGWWALYVYSRRQREAARRAEEAKYVVWDAAYKEAVKAGKTEYYALMDAVKAVGGDRKIFKVWEDTFNAAINRGTREYTAKLRATAAARKAAHEDKK
jgi:hypothetical protein